jgi:S-adenosylmethionine:tRNA-ribosyltransferase-isomerase (queuine synthetase)
MGEFSMDTLPHPEEEQAEILVWHVESVVRGGLAVLNNSNVIKARLFSQDHRVQLLLVESLAPRRGRAW